MNLVKTIIISLFIINLNNSDATVVEVKSDSTEALKENSIDNGVVQKSPVKSTRSQDIRENRKFTFNHGAGYFYDKVTYTSEIGYFIKPDLVLSLNYISLESASTKHDNELDKDITYDSGSGSAIELSVKSFQSNSLYIKAGAYYRNQIIVEKDIDDGGFLQFTSSENKNGEIEDAGVFFALGNQWQWSHFTMGCDWLGASSSLGRWKYTNEGEGQAVTLSSVRVLHFYLGASF
jgi:hypothetical protein